MKLYVKCSKSSLTAAGNTWKEFVQSLKTTFNFDIDSSNRVHPAQFITLYDDTGKSYTAVVNRYSDGCYELISDNIWEDNYEN